MKEIDILLSGFLGVTLLLIVMDFYFRGIADYGGMGLDGFLLFLAIWGLVILGRVLHREI